ncbi:MAG: Ldh family oxidoreductase [Rhizobiales bacterium]|nr:Ldh family oxidoreductase [Hyphomicrobiales bacterium]
MKTEVELAKIADFLTRCFVAGGFSSSNAKIVTDHLVDTEMRGISSHGINRLGWYLDLVKAKEIDPAALPLVQQTSDNSVSVNGNGGIGIVAMDAAVTRLIEVVSRTPIAMAGITNCGHTGRMGAYAEKAARAGCFAICCGGGGRKKWASVVPFGGTEPVMSTNPYTLALPNGEGAPFVCDFAISSIAAGKVAVALANGQLLPEGALIDAHGNPTRDPKAFQNGGSLLPAAGPKGSGLGIIAELVGDAMLGSALEFNWLMICIRADAFQPMDNYAASASDFAKQVRGTKAAHGFDKVMMPGDLEHGLFEEALRKGRLSINEGIMRGLKQAGEAVGEQFG